MPKPQRFVLWGSAGHAKVLADLIRMRGDRVVALFDNSPDATPAIPDCPLYVGLDGFLGWHQSDAFDGEQNAVVAIGGARGRDRMEIQALFREHGLRILSLVHPVAWVAATAILGEGCQVLAHALVASEARLGEACIVNHGASVDHECSIGSGVHIAPGAVLCGCVTVGDKTMIGAGAVVLPHLVIGENTVVGAGAVVTSDLPPGAVVVGNPSRIVRCVEGE